MGKEKLKRFKGKIHKLTREDQSKGGKTKTPARRLANTLNAMSGNKKLTSQQKYYIALLKDKRFADLICELIQLNLKEVDNPKRRDVVIDQLSKFMPSVNIEITKSDWDETYEKLEELKKIKKKK